MKSDNKNEILKEKLRQALTSTARAISDDFKNKDKLDKNEKSKFFDNFNLENLDSKKDFIKAEKYVSRIKEFKDIGTFENIIAQTIQSYNYLFLNGNMQKTENNLGKLTLINRAFQECYIDSGKDNNYFLNLINSEDGDLSLIHI